MSSDSLRAVRFRDLLVEPVRNGVYKQKQFHGGGCKIVNMGELFAFPRLGDVPMKRVALTEKELAKSSLQKGDLLFARRSLVASGAGRCSLVLRVEEPTTFESSLIRARPDPKLADSEYLYYYFASAQGREAMGQILRQVAVSGITGSDLMELQLVVPGIVEQRRLASVLSSLDDRIALLRETNATLEAIAQALFKSWFVDFDPVRAKQQGLAPAGMDEATAALFPDGFEATALELVPRSWRIEPVSAVCEAIFSGGTPDTRRPEYWTGDLRWFSSGETRDLVVVDTEKRINAHAVRNSSTRLTKPADILIASAGQGLTRGQTSYCAVETYINQSVVALRTDPAKGHAAWTFFNLSRRYDEMRSLSDSHSIRGSLTTKIIASMKVIRPPVALMHSFGAVVGPMLASLAENRRRSATLATLRDTLLPRLISGQLRLPEAAAELEAV